MRWFIILYKQYVDNKLTMKSEAGDYKYMQINKNKFDNIIQRHMS